jgi:glycopeptide antibiotics resistance protein
MPDVASNIALFFPFGLLLASVLFARLPVYIIFSISLLSGVFLSCFLETLQLFAVSRVTSLSDVINNGVGSLAGTAVAYLYHRYLSGYVETAVLNTLKRPILEVYAVFVFAGILFFALSPFDVSIDIGDLKNAVKHFLRYPYPIVPWKYMKSSINNFLLFFLAGAFLHAAFFAYRRRLRGSLYSFVVCFFFAVTVEILQLVIVSRSTSISNVFFAVLGASGGITVSLIYITNRRIILRANRVFLAVYAVYILFNTLFPFRIDWSLSSGVSVYTFIPFSMYFIRINIFSLSDLLTQIITFIPLGICGIFNKSRKKSMAFLTGLILGTILELSQVFIATRYCDSTDAILAGAGALAGNMLALRFIEFRKRVGS